MIVLTGRFNDAAEVIVRVAFPAPPGPDGGRRVELAVAADDVLIGTVCISPDGVEEGGVRAPIAWA